MSQYSGYANDSLEFLKKHKVGVGDMVEVMADTAYAGIIMPRYEHGDDRHIVLKLTSGYNVGLRIKEIKNVTKMQDVEKQVKRPTEIKHTDGLPRILLLSTGGTIASSIDYRTGAVTPVLSAEELVASVPELAGIANIEAEQILSEYSENIVPEHWVLIAEKISTYAKSGYSGIIVAHGTDTMHYTSAFLSFALAGFPIPIVLVGSQRSSDRASSDAALNLIGAADFISQCKTNGVYIAMHKDENDEEIACHVGTRVRKNHTSKRGAFQTIGGNPAFIVSNGRVCKIMPGRFFRTDTFKPRTKLEPRIMLVKYHPGLDPRLLDSMVDMGCRGIIFEGTGLGHVGRTAYESIRNAARKGVFMGMTSQCMDGRVSMTVYESGRDLLNMGIVPLEDMIPEVALVKAMWVFGNFEDEEAKRIMLENVASEISG